METSDRLNLHRVVWGYNEEYTAVLRDGLDLKTAKELAREWKKINPGVCTRVERWLIGEKGYTPYK